MNASKYVLSSVYFLLAALPLSAAAPATADRIDFKITLLSHDPFAPANAVDAAKKEFRRGEVVTVVIHGFPKPGYHTYPITQATATEEGALSSIRWDAEGGFKPLWPIRESQPEFVDTGLEEGFWLEYEKPFTWSQDVYIQPNAVAGTRGLKFVLHVQVCDAASCLWGDHAIEVPIPIADGPALPVTPELEQRLAMAQPKVEIVPVPAGLVPKVKPTFRPEKLPETPKVGPGASAKAVAVDEGPEPYRAGLASVLKQIRADQQASEASGLVAFMLTGVFWGLVSLVTPCVFPMIPITVSFFLKQSEKQHHKPVTMALVYCGTIVVVLTIAAVALLSFFRWLSVNPIMNFGLGALFIFFALSLFGMYEIELPSGLARYTSSREGQGGLAGTMFMALTFTIVSFACVAPFLGGFGGTAADSSITFLHRVLGGLAFAIAFAAPFFVLALFPSLLKKMPKSGSWLNSVKVVMGFLELAAALKFFRAGELVLLPKPAFFTFDLVLGIWIAMALLCGLYLLGFYRLPHDSPAEHLTVPRMLFGLAFISFGFYLLPAEFKSGEGEAQRPNGAVYAWVDSFLLPEPTEGKSELAWSGNLKRVVDQVRAENRKAGKPQLIFLDFTGETCTNCKLNERNVFVKPEIRGLFQRYQLVQLYTDKVPDKYFSGELRSRFGNDTTRQREDAAANLWFQKAAFNDEKLPLYVILEPRPDGTIAVLGTYNEGKINSDAAFAQFLKGPLENLARASAN